LLVLSQVVLSMQLPFAVIPLVKFVTDKKLMGKLVVGRWLAMLAWLIAGAIVVLNAKLLFGTLMGL
jgi:manganese transport protein